MREKIQRMMTGRYGADKMGQVLSIAALISVLISVFTGWMWFNIFGLFLLIWVYFRMFSKNLQKRYSENQAFMVVWNRMTGWFHRTKTTVARDKNYHIYKCPSCGQKVRIPRGKGKISIHCPKCGNDFIKRS